MSFQRFPSAEGEPERRASWIRAMCWECFVVKNFSRICGKRFPPEAFVRSARGAVRLFGGAIPSVFPD